LNLHPCESLRFMDQEADWDCSTLVRRFAHLAFAAFFALALRSSGVSLAALLFPPFEPPIFPNATACGFFLGISNFMPESISKKQLPRKDLTMRTRLRIIGFDYA